MFKYTEPKRLYDFYYNPDGENGEIYVFGKEKFPKFSCNKRMFDPPLDLLQGFDQFYKSYKKPKDHCHWNALAYINQTCGLTLKQITHNSNIFCFRGFLKDMMLLRVGIKLDYFVVAFEHNGIIFIEKLSPSEYVPDKKTLSKDYMKAYLDKQVTVNNDGSPVNSSINLNEGNYIIQTRTFKKGDRKIKVAYISKVDSISPEEHEVEFMEIKVCPGTLEHFFTGQPLYKTWAQSYVSGNSLIAAGIRKKVSFLKDVRILRLHDLEEKLEIEPQLMMRHLCFMLDQIINRVLKEPKESFIVIGSTDDGKLIMDAYTDMDNAVFSRPTKQFLKAFPK
uniref:Decapping nuclease n=1 Tax=Parastrongyloides trichosuri TaxID=131310 RepID=A0A0N4ZPN7_PARTI